MLHRSLLEEHRRLGIELAISAARGFSAFLPPGSKPSSPQVKTAFKRFMDMYTFGSRMEGFFLLDSRGNKVVSAPAKAPARTIPAHLSSGSNKPVANIVNSGKGKLLVVTLPWPEGEEHPLGFLQAVFSLKSTETVIASAAGLILLYIAIAAVLSLILGLFLLNKSLVRPVESLVQYLDRAGPGDMPARMEEVGGDEFASLSRSLRAMLTRIRSDKERLEQHVSELTRVNRKLEEAHSSLLRSEKLASVGRLAAGVAHEVGNPLSAILGLLSLVRRKVDQDPDIQDWLGRMEEEISRINQIVTDLLDFARPGETRARIVDPGTVMEDSFRLLESLKKFKSASPSMVVQPGLPSILCDPDRLKQVMINLLLNAADAVAGHSGEPRVSALVYGFHQGQEPQEAYLALLEGKKWAESLPVFDSPSDIESMDANEIVAFAVVDNGQGIEEHNLDKIFDPFFTTKEPGSGTGLGLSVSLRLVEEFGGRLVVQSKPKMGSRFQVLLPAVHDGEPKH